MNIRLLQIIILVLLTAILYPQKQTSIQPLSPKQSLAELNQDQQKISPKYESALKEYEKLIQKYPDNKELFYNLGNLNYRGGDLESALQHYRNSLSNEDPEKKAHSLYNMGNVYYNQGELQKSVELFKEALQLAPNDEDIRHNFELSKLMLKQQPPQQSKDQNQNGEEGDEKEQEQQKQQQSQEGDEEEQKKDSKEGQNENEDGEKQEDSSREENKEEKQSEQSQSREDEEKPEESQDQQSQPTAQEEKEKELGRKEAEAILNALKANESNMKRKKYKAVGRIKLEKDW